MKFDENTLKGENIAKFYIDDNANQHTSMSLTLSSCLRAGIQDLSPAIDLS
jgi:hypothetical protein